MLKIAGPPKAPPLPDSQEMPPEADPTQAPSSPVSDPSSGLQKVNQAIVVYRGPDQGPFQCSNCQFWQDPNACALVDGEIDPNGLCNIFEAVEPDPEQNQDPTQPSEGAPVGPDQTQEPLG